MFRYACLMVACISMAGCKKASDSGETQAANTGVGNQNSGPYSGGGNPTALGATQAVRGAVNRVVTEAEMKSLHLFMYNAYSANGAVPGVTETYNAVAQSNQQLYKLLQDGLIVLVPNPKAEGPWAYVKEAPTQGGFVMSASGIETKSPQELQQLLQQ